MAILGRTYVSPIITRSDPADFATVKNPVTLVQRADPPARIWFKSPDPIVSRSQTADFATVKQPVTTVIVAPQPDRIRFASQQGFTSRSSLVDVVPDVAGTRGPIVVVPVSARPTFTLPFLSRTSLEDFTSPVGRQPLVITSPRRPGLGTPAILTRSNPASFATTAVAPAIVAVQQVPEVLRRGFILTVFPHGNFVPPPPPTVVNDIGWCAQTPITGWVARDPVTDWDADTPGTNWISVTPEEDC